jgi:hypothetical protein
VQLVAARLNEFPEGLLDVQLVVIVRREIENALIVKATVGQIDRNAIVAVLDEDPDRVVVVVRQALSRR